MQENKETVVTFQVALGRSEIRFKVEKVTETRLIFLPLITMSFEETGLKILSPLYSALQLDVNVILPACFCRKQVTPKKVHRNARVCHKKDLLSQEFGQVSLNFRLVHPQQRNHLRKEFFFRRTILLLNLKFKRSPKALKNFQRLENQFCKKL